MPTVTIGAAARDVERALGRGAKAARVADPLIGRQHGHDARRIAAQHLERAEPDAGRRVARLRLDDDVLARHATARCARTSATWSAAVTTRMRSAGTMPCTRATVAPSKRLAASEHREELLGALACGDAGHSRVPPPPAMMSTYASPATAASYHESC